MPGTALRDSVGGWGVLCELGELCGGWEGETLNGNRGLSSGRAA